MQRNQLMTIVNKVADQSFDAVNMQAATKAMKVAARENADVIVNFFLIDNENGFEDLCEFLTDSFHVMKEEGLFGYTTGNVAGSQAKRQQAAARFFHRSVESLQLGFIIKGYNPFSVEATKEDKEDTPENQLTELAEKLSIDNAGVEQILNAYKNSTSRREARLAEARKEAKRIKEEEQKSRHMAKINHIADILAGMTAEQVEAIMLTAKDKTKKTKQA